MKLDVIAIQDSDSEKSREETQKVTRKSYSLKFKLECLDHFKKNGKASFWREYRGRVTMKTFHQWRKDEDKLRKFAQDRVGVDDFKRNRSSRYRVIFPELHDWAAAKQNVSRKELKTYGSSLMVRSKLVAEERTPLGHLSFNDMILAKFLKEYGSDFVRKPSYLPSGNENSKFVCDICNYRHGLATKETLRRHQLVHSSDRFWKCVLCDVRFKHFHGAISHGWKKHNKKIDPIKIGKDEVSPRETRISRIDKDEDDSLEPLDKENQSPNDSRDDYDFYVGNLSAIRPSSPLAIEPASHRRRRRRSAPSSDTTDDDDDIIMSSSSRSSSRNGSPAPPRKSSSTPKNRRTYSLQLKIEALDYFWKNGKKAFWKRYRGRFNTKCFSKWRSKEDRLRAEYKSKEKVINESSKEPVEAKPGRLSRSTKDPSHHKPPKQKTPQTSAVKESTHPKAAKSSPSNPKLTSSSSPKLTRRSASPKQGRAPSTPKLSKSAIPKLSKRPSSPKLARRPSSPKLASPKLAKRPSSPRLAKATSNPKLAKTPSSPKLAKATPSNLKLAKTAASPRLGKTTTKPSSPPPVNAQSKLTAPPPQLPQVTSLSHEPSAAPRVIKIKKLKNVTMEQRSQIATFIIDHTTADMTDIISHFETLWTARIPKYIIKNVKMEVDKLETSEQIPPLEVKFEPAEPVAELRDDDDVDSTTHYSAMVDDKSFKLESGESTSCKRPREPSPPPPSYLAKRLRNDSISSMSSMQSFGSSLPESIDSMDMGQLAHHRKGGSRRSRDRKGQPARPSEKHKVLDFITTKKRTPEEEKIERNISICSKCELTSHTDWAGELYTCQGVCKRSFHLRCFAPNTTDESQIKICSSCARGVHNCFDCGELILTHRGVSDAEKPELTNLDKDIKCGEVNCGKYYHLSCILKHKYSKYDKKTEKWTCPHHECHCCAKLVKENVLVTSKKNRPVLKCARCPAGYHQHTSCLPAGTFLLGGKNIICPKHFSPMAGKSLHRPIHSNSCFVCNGGGELIICDGCPAAYHCHCADQRSERNLGDDMALSLLDDDDDDESSWFCPYCKGDNPIMYGDLLWTKAGVHRWWPAVVVMPNEIPSNVFKLKSGPGEFVVRYLGTNDYNWMNRGRCFPYRGKDDDPYMVAIYHKETTQKTKRNTKEQQFHDGLVEAESLLADKSKEANSTRPFKLLKGKCPYNVNKPYSNNVPNLVRDNSFSKSTSCSCQPKTDHPCGEKSDCENRCLQIECSSDCLTGEKCGNQRFKRREYPLLDKFKTKWGGVGLKLKQAVKSGEFIIEYVGEIIDQSESKRRLMENANKGDGLQHTLPIIKRPSLGGADRVFPRESVLLSFHYIHYRHHYCGITNFYQINLDRDRVIDSGRAGNNSRFINHSCEPNCETQTWEVNGDMRIGIFALHSMEIGVELTFNYRLTQAGNSKTKCHCGAPHCAGYIGDPIKREREGRKEDKSEKASGKKRSKSKKSKKTPRVSTS